MPMLLLVGCGGGGGAGLPTFVLIQVELPGRDPLNLIVGEVVQFVLAGYDAGSRRFVLTADGWSMTNVQGVPGTLGPSGALPVTGVGSARINAMYRTETVESLDIVTKPRQAWVSGFVRDGSTFLGIPFVLVAFYDDANTQVGLAQTMADGSFLASVPITATKVNLVVGGWQVEYYNEWVYRTVRYSAMIQNCHAIMVLSQPLQTDVTSVMGDPIFLDNRSGPPPPPPNGCQ